MALVNRMYAPLWNGLPAEASDDQAGGRVERIHRPYFRLKQALDRVVGLFLMIASLPLLAALMIAIRLSSRGPAIYRQRRVGLAGRVFTMYKLRSMFIDAEAGGPQWANPERDPRVTPLGYWLRRLHLDELPQFINLVRGEMSLVGPRPERPEFVPILAQQIPGYLDRLRVTPGITGLAQVNLPADTDLASVERKLLLDLEYINNASVVMDLKLLICTALRVVGIKGARTAAVLGVQREVKKVTDSGGGGQPERPPLAPLTAASPNEPRLTPAADSAPSAETPRPRFAEAADTHLVGART